ncbi:unnamed protein product [Dracunculus medinensis]|uniref:Uncharacterized protein n=1 Tax=Dracunculus medinensis TaxID=318479 RepID=A0A0N4U936_DRAME|nr:unnamed protein product [Dracunculus medinensis]
MGDPEKLKIISEFLEKNELKNAHETYEWSSVEELVELVRYDAERASNLLKALKTSVDCKCNYYEHRIKSIQAMNDSCKFLENISDLMKNFSKFTKSIHREKNLHSVIHLNENSATSPERNRPICISDKSSHNFNAVQAKKLEIPKTPELRSECAKRIQREVKNRIIRFGIRF